MKPRPGIVQGAQNFKNNAEITADYRETPDPDPLFSRIRTLQIRQPACLRTAGPAQLKGHYVSADVFSIRILHSYMAVLISRTCRTFIRS